MARWEKNTVPCNALAPLVEKWSEEYLEGHPPHRGNQYQDDASYVEKFGRDEEWMIVLAFRCGTSTRTIRRVRAGGWLDRGRWIDYLSFDLADRIVIGCAGVLEWHTNADLIPYYGPLKVTHDELVKGYELPLLELEEAHAA